MWCLVVILALSVAPGAVPADQAPTAVRNEAGPKAPHGQDSNPVTTRTGGDTFATATVIPSLPFTDIGSTCGAANDYDAVCPYSWSTAPDVVYKFIPTTDMVLITAHLCDSFYDTKVHVYQNTYTPESPWACNDDFCSGPNYPYAYLSQVTFPVTAGNTYYIVIDGYAADCGTYIMQLDTPIYCPPICPPDGLSENEPVCGPDYVDSYNGGCSSTPPVFQPLCPPAGETSAILCGESGTYTYNGFSYRDTDWFPVWAVGGTVTMRCCAAFPLQLLYLSTVDQAACTYGGYDYVQTGAYVEAVLTYTALASEELWVWIGPSVFTGVPCGSEYVLTVDGVTTHPSCSPVSTQNTSWGRVKSMYR
jgi:hypothetical protein